MGLRYVSFRLLYEFKLRSGILKNDFPVNPEFKTWIKLDTWRKNAPAFFFESRRNVSLNGNAAADLIHTVQRIKSGELQFFQGEWKKVPLDDWLTNNSTGFIYSNQKHWTEIPDFNPAMGDIKYVWEKSRFGFFQQILRCDALTNEDSSHFVINQIISWIDHNPVNQGPNYRCSQETSLRVFNWTLALYFYRDSENLTEENFQKIMFSIYWQLKHVRSNIHFSRIAVRNNHAITETLALYTAGLLFPFFPEASEWKVSGKKWFEEEILYQIYDDGSYLQFSFNYHRVVIQLLTWGFSLSRIHGEQFSDKIYERAYKSVLLLSSCQDKASGQLPNYGANDGSLFFNWSDNSYRSFSSSLDTLHYFLTAENLYDEPKSDRPWFGLELKPEKKFAAIRINDGTSTFAKGGIYVFRKDSLLVVITCVSYKDRPSQADNLHLDLWHEGQNILRDGGSYQYNTDPEFVKYFFGTRSHNTIMIDDFDQMEKGSRFIWWGWTQASAKGWTETNEKVTFEGSIKAFKQIGSVHHSRKVTINKEMFEIYVQDVVTGVEGRKLRQLWHLPSTEKRSLLSTDNSGSPVIMESSDCYYSPTYGVKENARQIEFVTTANTITTRIAV